jgi:hypothetical protein
MNTTKRMGNIGTHPTFFSILGRNTGCIPNY